MAEMRIDPITKKTSIHNYLVGKPRIKTERILNHVEGQYCDFCHLTRQVIKNRNKKITDTDGFTRNILDSSDTAYSIANRWGLLDETYASGNPKESSEVVISKNHVHSLEELTERQARDLGELLERRYHAMRRHYKTVACFINCGVNAGGSLAHLHGQVVGSNTETNPEPVSSTGVEGNTKGCSVCDDVSLAEKYDTLIVKENPVTYIPYSPTVNMEVRSVVPCGRAADVGSDLIASMRVVLKSLQKLGKNVPYNIIMRYGNHSYAQMFLRIDSGIIYPTIFNLTPITINTSELAKDIQENI